MSADTLSGSCCRTNFFAAVYTRYALLRPWSRPSLRSTTRRISPSGVPSRTSSPGRSMSTSAETNHFLVNVNYQICLTPPTRRRSTFLSVVCDRSLPWHQTTDAWSRHLPVTTPGKETPIATNPRHQMRNLLHYHLIWKSMPTLGRPALRRMISCSTNSNPRPQALPPKRAVTGCKNFNNKKVTFTISSCSVRTSCRLSSMWTCRRTASRNPSSPTPLPS